MFGLLFIAALSAVPSAAEDATDAALVAAAQRGDVHAFGRLHARHYKRIYHLAYLKTSNTQDAEDVASETFIRALSSLGRFRFKDGQTSLYPWLHRIAVNLIVDGGRRRPAAGIVSLDAPVIAGMRALLDQRLPDQEPSPQEIVERHEVQQLVRTAIAALPPDQGDVLVYRFLGDLTPREIAPLLGRSELATKSLLHRATIALRGEIERRVDAVERLELHRERQVTASQEAMQHVGRS